MVEQINVFVSSTSRDLAPYRDAVTKVILRLGLHPIVMEAFNPTDLSSPQLCYDQVQQAHIFIGIYAYRYGSVLPAGAAYTQNDGSEAVVDGETSITQLEYQWAVARKLPLLLFMVSDTDAAGSPLAWALPYIEDEPGKTRLKRFKDLMMSRHVVGFFHSPDHLTTQAAAGLHDSLKQLQQRGASDHPGNVTVNAQGAIIPREKVSRDFYKHISLPPNYVVRSDLLAELRLSMLGSQDVALTSAIKGTTALHGMGGIGKSVMARALCDDPALQAAFPDGILWTTLGKEPNLITALREWIYALGGTSSENAPTVDSLRAVLAELLQERACLLILDDVWQKKHAELFRLGGTRCRMLLTTRDAEVARGIGADVYPIPAMSEREAVDLLKEWAGTQPDDTHLTTLTTIVSRLGRLPLAIKLAGAQLQHKSAEKWLERFDARKLKAKRSDNVHDSLELTFGLSLDELQATERRLYTTLSIFKEDEPIREQAIAHLWDAMERIDSDETEALLDDLAARSLLEVVGQKYPRAAVLHDLLRDFITAELHDPQAAHTAMLDAYKLTQRGDGWHTAPDDGYLHDHLVYHLEAVRAYPVVKALFATQDWMHARVPSDRWRYDGYLDDLAVYWRYSEATAYAQVDSGEPPDALLDCIRCALIRISINDLVDKYSPKLIVRAVELGVWSLDRAVSVINQLPKDKKRDEGLELLAVSTVLDGLSTTQRVDLAKQITNPAARCAAFVKLADQLEDDFRDAAFNQALDAINDAADKSRALIKLAVKSDGEQRDQLFARSVEAALSIEKPYRRVNLLLEIAEKLGDLTRSPVIRQAYEIAQTVNDRSDRVNIMIRLAAMMELDTRQPVIDELLGLQEPKLLEKVITDLVLYFNEETLNRAIALAQALPDQVARTRVLMALSGRMTAEMRDQVVSQALMQAAQASTPEVKAQLIPALADYFPAEQLLEISEWLLEAYPNKNRTTEYVNALHSIWKRLDQEAIAALVNRLTPQTDKNRDLLEILVPFVDDAQFEIMWQAARANSRSVVLTLFDLYHARSADRQRQDHLRQLVDAALQMKDITLQRGYRDLVVDIYAQQFDAAMVQASLDTMVILYPRHAIMTLLGLADHVRWADRQRLLEVVTDALPRIGKGEILLEVVLPRVMEAVRPHDSQVVQDKVFNVLVGTLDERAFPLLHVFEALDDERKARVIAAVRAAPKREVRAWGLSRIARSTHDEARGVFLDEAIDVAQTMLVDDERYFVDVVRDLLEWVQDDTSLRRLLTIVQMMQYPLRRAELMAAIAAKLPTEGYRQLFAQIAADALRIPDEDDRAKLLRMVAPQLDEELLTELLTQSDLFTNPHLKLEFLIAAANRLSEERKSAAIDEMFVLVSRIEDDHTRVRFLSKMGAALDAQYQQRILAISDAYKNSSALTDLAPKLTPVQLRFVFDAVMAMDNLSDRGKRLGDLVVSGNLPEALCNQAIDAIFAIPDEKTRANQLSHLAAGLTDEPLERAFAAALALSTESIRARVLRGFAHHHAQRFGSAFLDAARAINDEESRTELLYTWIEEGAGAHEKEALAVLLAALLGKSSLADYKLGEVLEKAARNPDLVSPLCRAMIAQLRLGETSTPSHILAVCSGAAFDEAAALHTADTIIEISLRWEWL